MDVLRHSPLFAGFTEEQLEMVPKMCIPHDFEPGATLVEEGEDTHSMWLIVAGTAEVFVNNACVTEHTAGEHFGELALISEGPRSASVVAKTAVTALEISRRQFEGLVASEPAVAFSIMGELGSRLRRATKALDAAIERHPEVIETIEGAGMSVNRRDGIEVLGAIEYALHLAD